MGVDVTWLMPFTSPQKLPFEVDYEVMTSFLELYQSLMKLINFKLYKDLGLEYPPPMSAVDSNYFGYNSLVLRNLQEQVKEANVNNTNNENTNMNDNDNNNLIDSEELKKIKKKSEKAEKLKNLLKNYVFFISREVPKEVFQLAIISMGGLYGDDSDESAFTEESPEITHFIVDRPYENIDHVLNKEYIQPQWIIDCLNAGKILPTSEYAPIKTEIVIDSKTGKKSSEVVNKLPPHVSPFYEYIPETDTYNAKDIRKGEIIVNDINEDIIEDEVLDEEVKEKERNGLNEMLLSKNKKKLLQKIRENNERKYKKRKIPSDA